MNLLSEDQHQFWLNNSYLYLPGLYSDISDDMSNWVEAVKRNKQSDELIISYEMGTPDQISRIENFTHIHDQLGELLLNSKAVEIISELMGQKPILYKERINYKLSGGGAHSAHQDGVAYEKGDDRKFDLNKVPFISILIAIDEANEGNGCLEIVPEWSLENDTILEMEFPDPDNPSFSKISQKLEDELVWHKVPTKPGDVIIFTERLPHRSAPNLSDTSRRILYGVYNPEVDGDQRKEYFEKKRTNINDPRYMVGNPHAPFREK